MGFRGGRGAIGAAPSSAIGAIVLAAAFALGACSGPVPLLPQTSTPTPSASGSAGLADVPQGFIECHGEPPKDGELVADVDLTRLTAPAPPGFISASGYYEDNPVEGDSTGEYWVPRDQLDMLDVASITVYPQMDLGPLAVTCDEISWRDITARIEQYHRINGADIIEETTRSSVAGMPAVREEVSLPDSGYDYVGWWIFGRGQLAHVYCQWTSEAARAALVEACDTLAASIVVE